MSSLHNDLHTWAGRARRNEQSTIYIDLSTVDKIVEELINKATLQEAATRWATTRSAFINLPMGSPDAKRLLNELSNAEDALRKVVEDD
jgi:hypothetical protein